MVAQRTRSWLPWIAYGTVTIAALLFTVLAPPSSAAYYRRFVGGTDPRLVSILAGVVGAACLAVLRSSGAFRILRRERLARGLRTAFRIATLFAVAIVVADLLLRYPIDLNAPLPGALAFYPSIGLIAEVAFHLVPLTIVIVLLLPFQMRITETQRAWTAIVIVALTEPVFQVLLGGGALTWLDAYTAVHVFAFALAQLYVFRRYDFMSMFALRLVYYLYWHIAWGGLRLAILF